MGAKHSVELRELNVRVSTWNLGNEVPTTGFPFLISGDDPDVYAVGVQEAVYEPREGFVDMEMDLFLSIHRAIGEDKYDNIWQQSLTPRTDKTYKSKADFIKAYKAHPERMSMSGIRICVFAKKSLAAEGYALEEVECLVQTCGRLDGISGNKGAVSVTCRIGETWITFLTGHLNAHTEGLERRIADMESIMIGLHRDEGEFASSDNYVASFGTDYQQAVSNVEVANRSHITIIFGDLNFRLEPLGEDGQPLEHEAQCARVMEAIDLRQWSELASFDQLLREQAKRRCFHQFVEFNGHPTWPPTFKLNLNPDADVKYNMKRCPSWCDRVLYKSVTRNRCEPLRYVAHFDYNPNTSDHVPVSADFKIEVRRSALRPRKAGFAAASKFFRSPTVHKERQLTLTNIRLRPAHDFVSAVYEDNVEDGDAAEALSEAKLIVVLYHPLAAARVMTPGQSYDPTCIAWGGKLEIKTRASVEELVEYPIILSVRNVMAEKNRLHRHGETMLDVRDMFAEASRDDPKAKLPVVGKHSCEVLQQGTPRGLLEFDFALTAIK
eukprot:m.211719 g.211719  ORF g.211719 m.211719 type:complete len:551 (+) comp25629_c0_seq1:245-1897(+)